jgi:transposase
MKALTEFKGVFLHKDPVDMRNAIDGLSQRVAASGMGELMGPYLFVFCGRRRNLIKVLYFDKSGFALWQKRLEKDKFPWPKKHEDSVVKLTPEQFKWLLDGYNVWNMKPFETLYFDRVS